jgi:hypothetical protein
MPRLEVCGGEDEEDGSWEDEEKNCVLVVVAAGALNGEVPLNTNSLWLIFCWVAVGGEVAGEKPLRWVMLLRLRLEWVCGEERGGEPMGPKSCEGLLWWLVDVTRRDGFERGRGEVGGGALLASSPSFSPSLRAWGKAGALASSPIAPISSLPIIAKLAKSVSLRGGAGAEGEMVAFRVGMGMRVAVGEGLVEVEPVAGAGDDGCGMVWTERVGAVDPESRGLLPRGAVELAAAFELAVIAIEPVPEFPWA